MKAVTSQEFKFFGTYEDAIKNVDFVKDFVDVENSYIPESVTRRVPYVIPGHEAEERILSFRRIKLKRITDGHKYIEDVFVFIG